MRQFPLVLLLIPVVVAAGAAVRPSGQPSSDLRAAMTAAGAAPEGAIWLDGLDLAKMIQRRQAPRAGQTLARPLAARY